MDKNNENEPGKCATSTNKSILIPESKNNFQKTSKQSPAKESINKPTDIGYSEGFSDVPIENSE